MAKKTIAQLTTEFGDGKTVSGSNFANIFDSNFNLSETGTSTAEGSLFLKGDLTANKYIVSSSVINREILDVSGSTHFGDTLDDVHTRTGSMSITGSLTLNGSAVGGAAFPFVGDAVITGSLVVSGSNAFRMDSTNVVLGQNAGGGSVDTGTDDSNIIIGKDAAGQGLLNSGDENVYIGHESGMHASTGDGNIAIRYRAGKFIDARSTNVFIGESAGSGQAAYDPGSSNVAIGYFANASQGASAGSSNVIIGTQAGQQKVGNNNVLLGRDAMYNAATGGDNSVIIGHSAGKVSAGDNNIFIGYECGVAATTGDNNILIGKGVEKSGATVSNELRIGNEAVIAISADLSTGDVSIGGTLSGDGSGLTNLPASGVSETLVQSLAWFM